MPHVEAPPSPNPESAPTGLFATAFKGYDRLKVDEYVGRLKNELAATRRHHDEATTSVAELTKSLSYTQKELTDTKSALARMADDPAGAAAMSERVKTMMKLAEEEMQELKGKAEQDAAQTRDSAEAYADKTRQKAEAVAAQLEKEAAEKRAHKDEDARQLRVAMQQKAEDEVSLMRSETEKRVAQHKQQVEQQVAAHKSEVEKRVAALDADAKARTEKMLVDANHQLAEATSTRKQVLELRAVVVDRLAASNSALQEALEKLGPDPVAAKH